MDKLDSDGSILHKSSDYSLLNVVLNFWLSKSFYCSLVCFIHRQQNIYLHLSIILLFNILL